MSVEAEEADVALDRTPDEDVPMDEGETGLVEVDDLDEGELADEDEDESLRLDPNTLPVPVGGGAAVAVARPVSRKLVLPDWLLRVPGVQFIYESYLELAKVTWPTRADAWNMTLVVLAMSAVVAVILGVADIVLAHALGWILSVGNK
jgi:preprotein translocase SecE subunit